MTDTTKTLTRTDPYDADAPPAVGRRTWWAVVSLGLGIFTLVASEFLPASLLTPIASDLGLSEGRAGQLVTATAVVGILAGPALVALLPSVDRRLVMLGLTLLSVGSNLLVALAPGFAGMLVGRALLGVALSGFWALSLAVVSELVPEHLLGRAMTVVNAGVSVATVAAIPVGAFVADHVGWQAAFVGAAALGVVTFVLQLAVLPSIQAREQPGIRSLVNTLRTPVIAIGFGGLALLVVGHTAAFTYVRPMLDGVDGLDTGLVAVLLAVFGVSAFVGNLLAGYLADRWMRPVLVLVPVLLAAGTGLLAAQDLVALAAVAVAGWGLGFGAVPTMLQTWLGRVAPDRLESAGSLTVATFQVSIALGAAVGGVVVDDLGVRATFALAAAAALLAVAVFARVRTHRVSAAAA